MNIKDSTYKNSDTNPRRLRIIVIGAVQGVGFRPFVFRLASELGLTGWVNNSPVGVFIEVEGARETLEQFLARLQSDKPALSSIHSLEAASLDLIGYDKFEVRPSDESGQKLALVMPDIAVCDDCLREMADPNDRRYRYPFINCTNCGPRYSIIEALPYDRPNSTMKLFPMCDDCRAEYENPADRRFHAQPIACSKCGPRLELWDAGGKIIAKNYDALEQACEAIKAGRIVAIKGLGGFHLVVDAANEDAVKRLRYHKNREEKPLAMMYQSWEKASVDCEISPAEKRLLHSPESPIVLLKKQMTLSGKSAFEAIAPNNPYLGVMLPYTPIHHLLIQRLDAPIVATSGNLSDEPICIDEHEASDRLKGIADLFLAHNRPIRRHVDDSIVRIMAGQEMVMRRARGYAPLPIYVKQDIPKILAVGAHLKNAVAISIDRRIFISQHIGDLETTQAYSAFEKAIESLSGLYDFKPEKIACDDHPNYLSSQYARKSGLPLIKVQHHYAHILGCMAENELDSPVLGVSWDGTGFGLDGTIWGGEFLRISDSGFDRAAHLRNFGLPGGDKAVKEPRRTALGILYEIYGEEAFEMTNLATIKVFEKSELPLYEKILKSVINCPKTSSAGRLFDAVSSLVGLRQITNFEGQAAMELEFAISGNKTEESYDFGLEKKSKPCIINWQPMIKQIIEEINKGVAVGLISAKFHNTLTEIICAIAKIVNCEKVVLSGGCFQNKYLIEKAIVKLRQAGFRPYWNQRIPPNDGGIALGQIMAVAREKKTD
jgi:hydrogenase maturation protein HypF